MSTEISDRKEIKLLSDIFSSPQDAFESYQRNEKFSRITLIRIHFSLFLFAPAFKLLHNLFFINVGSVYFKWDSPTKLTDGITTSILIYPVILFLIYHLDILLLKLKAGEEPIEAIEERDLLLISFIPFSASFLFWIFPKPINFFLILGSVGYSFYLGQMALRSLFGFTAKQFIVFTAYVLIFCFTLSAIGLTILNLVRR